MEPEPWNLKAETRFSHRVLTFPVNFPFGTTRHRLTDSDIAEDSFHHNSTPFVNTCEKFRTFIPLKLSQWRSFTAIL